MDRNGPLMAFPSREPWSVVYSLARQSGSDRPGSQRPSGAWHCDAVEPRSRRTAQAWSGRPAANSSQGRAIKMWTMASRWSGRGCYGVEIQLGNARRARKPAVVGL